MCGIAGVYGRADRETGRRMQQALHHRGPDARGLWCDERANLTLAHTRLAILDPTARSEQPFHSSDGRFVLVFNGEIYNFRDLRRQLEGLGHRFQSEGDTEVLLAAFAQWGLSCLPKLDGMFAFALADRQPQDGGPARLYLVRDRLGIKPLLYWQNKDEFWFASELRAFLSIPGFTARVDRRSLVDYLAVGAVNQPATMLERVRCIPPGHCLELRSGESRWSCYWDLERKTAASRLSLRDIGPSEAVERLRVHLEEAVRSHMVSDVPVGVFLSGGLDSSTVAAIAARWASPLRTYCVGFANSDERAAAARTAKLLGADHREIVVERNQVANLFEDVVYALDQPSADGANTWLACQMCAGEVTVVLSGLGADELFNGYRAHQLVHLGSQLPILGRFLGPALDWANRSLRGPKRLLYWLTLLMGDSANRVSSLRRLLSDWELRTCSNLPLSRLNWGVDRAELPGRLEPLQSLTLQELKGYLLRTLLRDNDATSMSCSLELRPVFLDHRLVEFAVALPDRFKIRDGASKWLLREVAKQYLPAEITGRTKRGFELPFPSWMEAGPLNDRLQGLLAGEHAEQIFSPSYLSRLHHGLKQRRPDHRLWAWGVLLAWLERHQVDLGPTWSPVSDRAVLKRS